MKKVIGISALCAFALSLLPVALRPILFLPKLGGTLLGTLAERLFFLLVYPPVYLAERLGWYDAYRAEVLTGVSVVEPPSALTGLWTHFAIAFPFWLAVSLVLLMAVRVLTTMALKQGPPVETPESSDKKGGASCPTP